MDSTILYLLGGVLYLVVGSLYFEWRVRRFRRRLLPDARQWLQRAFFDAEDVDDGKGGKVRVLRPNEALKAFLGASVPPFVEYALASVKLKLPKFAPVNPATGALDFTAGIAAKMADNKNVKPEEIAKSLFMQFGVPFIQEKLGPFLQGLAGGAKPAAGKETPNPFIKELAP